jgi:hypothetical protein
MSEFYCMGGCSGDVFFYEDTKPLCIVNCRKSLKNDERCDECFVEVNNGEPCKS